MSAGMKTKISSFMSAFLCLFMFLLMTSVSPAFAEDSHTPLEPIECPGNSGDGELVVCFILHVPADWNDISNRTMRLPVMRFAPANGRDIKLPPLLILAGGPGQAVVPFAKQILNNLDFLRQDREVILMDQRGTGPLARDVACKTALKDDGQIEVDKIADCVKAAEEAGHFLADYSTDFAVQDYRALRYALKIDQWAVLANSYGARVAQGLVREDEKGIDRILFNGPLFIGTRFFDWKPFDKVEEAIELCNETSDCRDAFPNLYWDFQRLPFDMRKAKLPEGADEGALQVFLYQHRLQTLLARHDLAQVPADITKTAKSLTEAIESKSVWTPPSPLPPDMDDIGLLMHFAILCAEDIEPLANQGPSELAQPLQMSFYRAACKEVKKVTKQVVKLEKGWDSAARTTKPVLILNGRFDTAVDPQAAEKTIAAYPNGVWINVAFAGHDLVSRVPCAREMALSFFEGNDVVEDLCIKVSDWKFKTD